eukprot:966214_1
MGNQNRKPSGEDAAQSKYPFGHQSDHPRPTTGKPRRPGTISAIMGEIKKKIMGEDTLVFDPTSPIAFRRTKLERDRNICNPFVTEIITYEKPISTIHNDEIKSKDTPSAQPQNIQFGGELFGYWESDSPTTTYVAPQYETLKDEITNPNNEVYVSSDVYETHF